jgi:hypothetical protein
VLIAGALVVATLVGGYWFFLRGDATAAGDFIQSERRVAAAGRVIPEAGSQVQRFLQLEPFNVTVDEQLAIIRAETAKLQRMADGSEGDEAAIARAAVAAATRLVTSAESYRRAITRSFDIADAEAAHVELDRAIAKLERQARAWKNL